MEKLKIKTITTNKNVLMKQVPGFERYYVSSTGDRVYDRIDRKNLYIYQDELGYQWVYNIWSDEGVKLAQYPIHRLVALTFCYDYKFDKCNIVHHIDENPSNNDKSNLIWVDRDTHWWIHNYLYKNNFRITSTI